jgi:hypothetical protein
MMHGCGKSDLAIVAVKPANNAEHPAEQSAVEVTAAEPVERRAEAKGNAGQQSTCRTQSRAHSSCEAGEQRGAPCGAIRGGGRRPRGMRASKARAGRRAGQACHRFWNAYGTHLPL